MKQKLLEMIQVNVWLHTDAFILFGFTKTKSGAKTELLRRAGATTQAVQPLVGKPPIKNSGNKFRYTQIELRQQKAPLSLQYLF